MPIDSKSWKILYKMSRYLNKIMQKKKKIKSKTKKKVSRKIKSKVKKKASRKINSKVKKKVFENKELAFKI